YFAMTSSDLMAVDASFAFDISLLELMTAWTAGGCTLVVSRADVLEVERFLDRIQDVTIMLAMPSLMRHLVAALRKGRHPLRLRTMLTGGDLVPHDLVTDMKEVFAGCRIQVLYGPTETSMICAGEEIFANSPPKHSPVGKPIANARIYILDERRQPV